MQFGMEKDLRGVRNDPCLVQIEMKRESRNVGVLTGTPERGMERCAQYVQAGVVSRRGQRQ